MMATLLKRKIRLILLSTWSCAFVSLVAINGFGEVESRPALIVIAVIMVMSAAFGIGLLCSARFRELVVASEHELARQRSRVIAAIIAAWIVAAACLWKL